MNWNKESTGQIEFDFSYLRHVGGHFVHGAVKLRFNGSQPYTFSSSVAWPDNANYEAYVQAGVEEALQDRLGSLEKTEVQLIAINIDPINSSAQGFKLAARAATLAAFFV
jgi:hypothetical protein